VELDHLLEPGKRPRIWVTQCSPSRYLKDSRTPKVCGSRDNTYSGRENRVRTQARAWPLSVPCSRAIKRKQLVILILPFKPDICAAHHRGMGAFGDQSLIGARDVLPEF